MASSILEQQQAKQQSKHSKLKHQQSGKLHSVYSSMLERLYARAPLAAKKLSNGQRPPPSLAPMYQLASLLENPQKKYQCIHIGGTNGKGSVATKIANVLCKHNNLRVGLLTSPHISCIRERIRVNNEMISENDFVNGLNKIFDCETMFNKNNDSTDESNNSNDGSLTHLQANFFEIMTILAYHHFYKEKCDVAVIEVGIGYVVFDFFMNYYIVFF